MNNIKKIIIMMLIIFYTFNNYASIISVSDGSSFVTKAEFSTDLNNLTNRMSTLENSLDSKIDSLVSSYLNKNGIWNSSEQDISESNSKFVKQTTGTFKDYYVFEDGTDAGKRYLNTSYDTAYSNNLLAWLKTFILDTGSTGGSNTATRTSASYIPYLLLINKIKKSGLCNLMLNLSPMDSGNRLGCAMLFTPSVANKYIIYPMLKVDFVFYNYKVENGTGTYTEVGRFNVSDADVTYGNAEAATIFSVDTTYFSGLQQLYFFVEKDTKLYLRPEFTFGTVAADSALYLTRGSVAGGAGSGTLYYRYAVKAFVY